MRWNLFWGLGLGFLIPLALLPEKNSPESAREGDRKRLPPRF